MDIKHKKDKREKLWSELELTIQKNLDKKDKKFCLSGKWKKFIKIQDNFKIFAVDGEWINNNLSIIFGHGGHGYVHEFIPFNEIWIATYHPKACGCKKIKKGRKVSPNFFSSTVIHEISEFKEMKKGLNFWSAHQIALQKERESGILEDPFEEKYN